MVASARLNLLVTHREAGLLATLSPWYETVTHLLAPLGVRTYEATNASQAIALIEQQPIHLAVVDTRLEGTGGQLGVLRLIQRLRDQDKAARQAEVFGTTGNAEGQQEQRQEPDGGQRTVRNDVPLGPFRIQVQVQPEQDGARIEVRFNGRSGQQRPAGISPTVILLTPSRDDALLHEALKCDAFSVVTEPVDLNLMLEIMARALKRFHQNQWPQ